MKPFLDGTASVLAALATILICGLPCWFTYKAIDAGVAPTWAWAAIAALGGVGVIMTFAFLRKATGGVSPTRERKRR
jgi:predicted FMN-binding regulatory protein PaiB